MGRIAIALIASAIFCVANAQGNNPGAAPVPTRSPLAQPNSVPNYIANQGGSTVLQNGAGSIYTRPDGRTVLIGGNGQMIITGDSDSIDSDEDDNVVNYSGGANNNNNVIINGRTILGGGGGANNGVIINGRHSTRIVDGALVVNEDGREYVFQPRAPGVTEQEVVDINGEKVTVYYEQGGVRLERQDGTVIAFNINGEGLFMGNRESYANRQKILEDIPRQTAQIQEEVQRTLDNVRRELEQGFGNIRF